MRGNVLLLRSLEQRARAFSWSGRGGGGRLRSRKILIEHEENALVKLPGNEVLVEVSKVPQPRPLIKWHLKRNAWARCIYADMCMSMAGSDGWSGGGVPWMQLSRNLPCSGCNQVWCGDSSFSLWRLSGKALQLPMVVSEWSHAGFWSRDGLFNKFHLFPFLFSWSWNVTLWLKL